MDKIKTVAFVWLALAATSALAQTDQNRKNALPMLEPGLKTEKKWTLRAKLLAESKEFESTNVGINEIHGFPSNAKCMQAGFLITRQLNTAITETNQSWKQENTAEWSCHEDDEVLANQQQ